MMKVSKILSDRNHQNWPSWFIVYEWENEIAEKLNIPIVKSPNENSKIRKLENRFFKGRFSQLKNKIVSELGSNYFYFEMTPRHYNSFSNNKNAIPVIIDYWDKSRILEFNQIYGKCPLILVSSLEVINFLNENNFPGKIVHFPLCLPTKYKLSNTDKFEKNIDLVLAGRTNSVLWDFLQLYEKENPTIEYYYQIHHKGQLYYKSNNSDELFNVHTREEYFNLIKRARVTFYNTPGMDDGAERTNGFNPVTPRLFELLSAGCHVIARYPKNVETEFFKLNTLMDSIETYEEFKKELNFALSTDPPIERNSNYLKNHYTSERIKILKNI